MLTLKRAMKGGRARTINRLIRVLLPWVKTLMDEDIFRKVLRDAFDSGWTAAERSRDRLARHRLKS